MADGAELSTQGSPPAVGGSTPNVAHIWNHGAYGIGRLQLVSDAYASSVHTCVVTGLGEHSSATGRRALYVYLGSEKPAEYRSNATWFYHNDHLGTAKAVTDHNGTVLERWDHYPFGEEWVSGLSGDRYRYTGHLRDQETGNDYAGARYYSNARGRWLSVDPVRGNVGDPQSLNRYAYVGNDVVNIVDPDGMEWAYVIPTSTHGRGPRGGTSSCTVEVSRARR